MTEPDSPAPEEMGPHPPRTLRIRKRRRGAGKSAKAAQDRPRSWYRDETGATRRDLDPKEFPGIAAGGTGMLWVDIDLSSAAQQGLLAGTFKFHPLSVQDTLSADGRVKVEEYPGYALVVVRGVPVLGEAPGRFAGETLDLRSVLG